VSRRELAGNTRAAVLLAATGSVPWHLIRFASLAELLERDPPSRSAG
jgi:hypothetical protein